MVNAEIKKSSHVANQGISQCKANITCNIHSQIGEGGTEGRREKISLPL